MTDDTELTIKHKEGHPDPIVGEVDVSLKANTFSEPDADIEEFTSDDAASGVSTDTGTTPSEVDESDLVGSLQAKMKNYPLPSQATSAMIPPTPPPTELSKEDLAEDSSGPELEAAEDFIDVEEPKDSEDIEDSDDFETPTEEA